MRTGALVAVLLAGLAIPLLRHQLRPAPDEPPAPVGPVLPDIGRIEQPVVYDVDLVDERHGFALWGRCTNGRDYRCERKLLTTTDGVVWNAHQFASGAPDRLTGRVIAIGPGRVVLTGLDAADRRLYSADNGQTWQPVSATPQQTVTQLPADAILETRCVDTVHDLGECRTRRLAVTLPDSGRRAWLANPPALDAPAPQQRAMADGSWWVSGKEPGTGRWAVAASRDAGRTWAVTPLPVPPELMLDRLSLAGSGQDVYALGIGSLIGAMEPNNLLAIFGSTDGGHTWAQTWRADGRAPRTLGGEAIVTADGSLYVPPADVGPGYRSRDGGRSFAMALDGPRLTSVRRTRGGYLAVPTDRPGRYLSSPDGVRWSTVPLP
jgi:hypothetical protein